LDSNEFLSKSRQGLHAGETFLAFLTLSEHMRIHFLKYDITSWCEGLTNHRSSNIGGAVCNNDEKHEGENITSMPEKLETVLDKISTITYTHQIFSYL
jgi:hypothetical protein